MFTIYKRDRKKTSYILCTPILILTFANAKSPVSMLETGLFYKLKTYSILTN